MSLPWGQHQRKVHLQMLVTVNAQINRMYPVLVSGFFFFFLLNFLLISYTICILHLLKGAVFCLKSTLYFKYECIQNTGLF